MSALLLEAVVILLLLVVNGVFSMTEMAVVSARKTRLRVMAEGGSAGARAALALAESPNRFLPSVQFGITLVGLLAGAFGGITFAEHIAAALEPIPVLAPYAEAIGVVVVVVALTYLSLVIGELVPKRLALSRPEVIASFMARPMDLLSRLARPVVQLLGASTDLVLRLLRLRTTPAETVSDEEVKVMLDEGWKAGVFHEDEPRMVESVLAFDQRPVSELMTPRAKLVFLHQADSHETVWHKIVVSAHSSYPVYDTHRDHVVGVVSVKDIYAHVAAGIPVRLADVMIPPLYVPATETVTDLLSAFRKTRRHIAVVTGEAHQVVGLVTLVDVLEAIVGDLPSLEEREKPEARRRDDGSWLVDGGFAMTELTALLAPGSPPPAVAADTGTLAGFVSTHLGAPLQEGAGFVRDGVRFEIIDLDGTRIDKVLLLTERDPH